MIKLLKYDFKQNMNAILGTFAVLVIVQIMLSITAHLRNWDHVIVLTISILLYSIVGIVMVIMTCRTFQNNIMAYHVRLLPVRSIWMVISTLLLGVVTVCCVTAIMVIHLLINQDYFQILLNLSELNLLSSMDISFIFLETIWTCIFMILMIFFAITVGASLRKGKNAGTWVGIITFFALQNLVGWAEMKLFDQANNPMGFTFFELKTNVSNTATNTEIQTNLLEFQWGAFAYELIVVALMVWAITYLINKRVEV